MTDVAWQSIDAGNDPDEIWTGHDPALVIDAWGELLALLDRPWWHQHAACRGQGTPTWFPTKGESPRPAREVCAGCTVRDECTAAGRGEEDGVWGGLTGRERRRRSAA